MIKENNMTTDELNAIVKAVMDELEKAGVDFDFKAETPQPTDLVYVMRGTADKYQGITVKWQNLLDLIVKKATDAKDEAVSAKDIALQTLATIQGIESNVSSMKSSVDESEANVASMKASVETSEANVTQMKSEVSEMKASVEGTKTEVEGLKSDVTALKAQTQTIVDNAKEDVTGLLDTKVNYSDSLTYEEIMATNPVPDLTNKVASANSVQTLGNNIYSQIRNIYGIPYYSYQALGADATNQDYLKKWLDKVWTDHKDAVNKPIFALVNPNSIGVVVGNIYNNTDDGSKIKYADFVLFKDGQICTFGYSDTDVWYFTQK